MEGEHPTPVMPPNVMAKRGSSAALSQEVHGIKSTWKKTRHVDKGGGGRTPLRVIFALKCLKKRSKIGENGP